MTEEFRDNQNNLSYKVLNFWGLTGHALYLSPLYFDNANDWNFFVRTQSIENIKDIKNQCLSSSYHRIILVIGTRGSGKTTSILYLSSILDKDATKKIAFIECKLRGLDKTDIERFRLSVNRSILDDIKTFLQLNKGYIKDIPITEIIENIGKVIVNGDKLQIDNKIDFLIKTISKKFDKTFLFVDNLDKVVERYEEIGFLKNYFTLEQNLLESSGSQNTYFFISLQSFVANVLVNDQNTNYISGDEVNVELWSDLELDNLLEKRLSRFYVRKELSLDHFFSKDARKYIYTVNSYNPRWCLIAATRLLITGYNSKIKGPINDQFCRHHPNETKAVKLDIAQTDFENVDYEVRRNHKSAFDKITNTTSIHKINQYEIIDTLIDYYKYKNIQYNLLFDILETNGFFLKSDAQYTLSPDINKLFLYLEEDLKDWDKIKEYFYNIIQD